jgi:hypothetical protein
MLTLIDEVGGDLGEAPPAEPSHFSGALTSAN